MKKLTAFAVAVACSLGVVAQAAAGPPPPDFTYTNTVNGTSLLGIANCTFDPCGYNWREFTGVNRLGDQLGSGRSLVVQLAPGWHSIQLVFSQRKYRASPTWTTSSVTKQVFVP